MLSVLQYLKFSECFHCSDVFSRENETKRLSRCHFFNPLRVMDAGEAIVCVFAFVSWLLLIGASYFLGRELQSNNRRHLRATRPMLFVSVVSGVVCLFVVILGEAIYNTLLALGNFLEIETLDKLHAVPTVFHLLVPLLLVCLLTVNKNTDNNTAHSRIRTPTTLTYTTNKYIYTTDISTCIPDT